MVLVTILGNSPGFFGINKLVEPTNLVPDGIERSVKFAGCYRLAVSACVMAAFRLATAVPVPVPV